MIFTAPTMPADLSHVMAQSGLRLEHIPLLSLAPIALDPRALRTLQGIDQFKALHCVSAYAAQRLFAELKQLGKRPRGALLWMANGQTTADVFRVEGVDELAIKVPSSGHTAEDVLALAELQQIEGERILLVSGEGGREILEGELSKRGALVERIALYQRQTRALTTEQCQLLLQQRVILQSLSAMNSLISQLPTKELSIAVSSTRLLQAAQQHRWKSIKLMTGIDSSAIMELQKSES